MNEILHANIFFVIASIATVCFCILVSIVLFHLIKIMQSVRRVLDRVEEGSEVIAEDLSHLRAAIMEGGIVSRLIGLFFGGTKSGSSKRKRPFTSRKQKTYGNEESSEEEQSI